LLTLSLSVVDGNPEVRTWARKAFAVFKKLWPQRAEILKNKLDPSAQKQVRSTKNKFLEVERY